VKFQALFMIQAVTLIAQLRALPCATTLLVFASLAMWRKNVSTLSEVLRRGTPHGLSEC
jgi:hypothetical protein